ncbi:MAG: hypothetical protein QOJ12_3019 [Thermoleophilales bacterium]|nr:hypothetical protein [Thermoleophilales bacterium]
MSVQFEVERFEWAADDRLELEGRWFGLRGRRFIRPTLDVDVDGEQRRLLALMEHKPWAALDGEAWLAAFAWDGDHAEIAAQLAVGSDLSFELPQPGGASTAAPKGRKRAAAAQRARPARDDDLERRLATAERDRAESAGETQALQRALAQKERTVRELEEALSKVRDAAAAAAAAVPTPATSDVEDLSPQLDAAVGARDAALAQVAEAERERYEALGALAAAEREATAATHARDQAHAEREEARTAARDARAERDALRRERDAAVGERDAAHAKLDATRRDRDSAQLARDAARAERPQVSAVAEAVRRRGPQAFAWLHRDRTHDEVLAMRFAALVALSVVCLLIAIWILAV